MSLYAGWDLSIEASSPIVRGSASPLILLPRLPHGPHGDGYIVGLSRAGHPVEAGVNDDNFVFHVMSVREKFLKKGEYEDRRKDA